MPRKIENVREKLMAEAKRQVNENGFAALSVRSVAKGVGICLGTVYSYFPSKESLVIAFMTEDWNLCRDKMIACIKKEDDPISALRCVYEINFAYFLENKHIFSDNAAKKIYGVVIADQYKYLINNLSEVLLPLVENNALGNNELTLSVLAQSIINFTGEEYKFEDIEGFYRLLLNKN